MSHNVVFMGSPEFALPTLISLANSFKVAGVVTQPDRRAGRGKVFKSPPIKDLSLELNIPFIQPDKVSATDAIAQIQAWNPDVIVVAAYGQILRRNLLELAPFGCVNVHASLLPRWRGAAPINAAILHGDQKSGITIMKMDRGIDTGPILAQSEIALENHETAGSLSARLADLGGMFLSEILPKYLQGDLQPSPQEDAEATYAPMLTKQDGLLDFTKPAEFLSRQVRAYSPWPGTFLLWKKQPMKIHKAHAIVNSNESPGTHGIQDGLPVIATAEGTLILDEVQPAGKKKTSGDAFLNGARGWEDEIS